MQCSMPGSSIHGISQAKNSSGLPFPSLGDLFDPGIEPTSLALARSFCITTEPPGKPLISFSSVQSLNHVQFFVTPWTAVHQASLSITNSQSLLKLMPIESVVSSNHLISVIPFSSHLQSFPASGAFQMSQLFASGGQFIGASASTSVLTMNIQD